MYVQIGIVFFIVILSITSLESFHLHGKTAAIRRKVITGPSDKAREISATLLRDSTLVEASYNLAAGSATLGLLCGFLEDAKGRLAKVWGAGAIIFTLFGGFVAYQTTTLSFKFDDDSFSLINTADGKNIGENVVVEGENDWKYSSIVSGTTIHHLTSQSLCTSKRLRPPLLQELKPQILL